MVTIESITVAGFGSYGPTPQTLELGGQGPVAIVGDNGAGKSTVASKALTWCLYGKATPERMGSGTRALGGRAIVSKGQPKAEVTVRVRDAHKAIYEIKRVRGLAGSDTLEIALDGAPLADAGQHTVDALLGATYDVWCRTVVRGQADPWSFAEATDARKREILDAISGAEALAEQHAKAKAARQEAEAEAKQIAREIEHTEHALGRYDTAKTEAAAEAWNATHAERCARLKREIEALEKAHAEAVKADAASSDNSAEHATLLASEPALDWSPYIDAIKDAQAAYNQAFADHRVFASEASKIAALAIGEACPTCGQTVGISALEGLSSKSSEADQASKALDAAKAHRDACAEAKRGAEEWLESERSKWRERLAECTPRQAQAPAVARELEHARARFADVQAQINPHMSRIVAELEQTARLNRELQLARARAKSVKWIADAATAWEQALGPKGARAHLAEATIQAIEASANRWLAVLSDRKIEVEFQATREVKGHTKDEIKTYVYADGEQRDLLTYSGGERKRVNLAVDLGVAEACAGGGLAVSLLVLDEEVFSGLDEHGKAAVVDALHNAGIADVVIIDHDPRLSSTLRRTIKVSRDKHGHSIMTEL
jgi:DNA repair exonuclease SbcCD ATPase subunit